MAKRKFFYLFLGVITLVLILIDISIFRGPVKTRVKAPAPVAKAPAPIAVTPIEAPEPGIETPETEVQLSELPVVFQKGMIYVSWTEHGYSNSNSIKAMEQLAPLGVEWVGLATTFYQDKYDSCAIYPIPYKTASDESIIFAIRKLHELKFKVMLKPHLDLVNPEGKWRGEINFATPEQWRSWFEYYNEFILHYAKLAAQENVELLCIGTELTRATLSQPQAWRDLIKQIREVYKGQLTYAANWHLEYNQIEFWNALDYAGIDAYFPLVCTDNPQVEELKSAWSDWLRELEAWQKRIKKPVIFVEVGYKSCGGATDEPWQHIAVGNLDLQLQVNCYQALLETFWDKPWFYGVYWWYWGVHPKMGGEFNRGFTPQNKPAQETIREWYSKPVSQKAY